MAAPGKLGKSACCLKSYLLLVLRLGGRVAQTLLTSPLLSQEIPYDDSGAEFARSMGCSPDRSDSGPQAD